MRAAEAHRARGQLRRLRGEPPLRRDQRLLPRRSQGPRTGDSHDRSIERQDRSRHRRGPGHRPRHRGSLPARGRAGLGDRSRHRQARRARRRRAAQARRSVERGGCGARARDRAGRHPRQRAGFVHHGTVLDCSDRDWDFSFDLNVKSMHRTIKAYLPGHAGARAPARSSTSPPAPRRCAASRTATSTAPSKAAVIGLTKAVAADFIKRGIRSNAICPGTIQSPSLDERIAGAGAGLRPEPRGRAPGLRRPPADGPARHGRGGRRGSRSISPPTRRATRPGRSISSTAVSHL